MRDYEGRSTAILVPVEWGPRVAFVGRVEGTVKALAVKDHDSEDTHMAVCMLPGMMFRRG